MVIKYYQMVEFEKESDTNSFENRIVSTGINFVNLRGRSLLGWHRNDL